MLHTAYHSQASATEETSPARDVLEGDDILAYDWDAELASSIEVIAASSADFASISAWVCGKTSLGSSNRQRSFG